MKVLLQRKNKLNLCIFFVPYRGVPYPWYEVHILTRICEKTKSNFGDYVTKWDVENSSWISLILTTRVNFEKKLSLSGVIVSVHRRRKDIKVTFVSFGLHTGRFSVVCKEYGNTLFSYYDIFIYVSSNFTLDSRITG